MACVKTQSGKGRDERGSRWVWSTGHIQGNGRRGGDRCWVPKGRCGCPFSVANTTEGVSAKERFS